VPRRHAGADAGDAGADTGAFSRTYLFSDDAPTFIHADDAGAVAGAFPCTVLFSDDP